MGGVVSLCPVNSQSVTIGVNAPPDVLWTVIRDLGALPDVLSAVTAVDVKSDDRIARVGVTFSERRRYEEFRTNEHIVLLKAVTKVSNDPPYALGLNVKMPDMVNFTNTSTLEVHTNADDENKCLLIGTLAFLDARVCSCLSNIYFHLFLRRVTKATFAKELQDYASAAEERFQKETP
jgi:hypothetical protein